MWFWFAAKIWIALYKQTRNPAACYLDRLSTYQGLGVRQLFCPLLLAFILPRGVGNLRAPYTAPAHRAKRYLPRDFYRAAGLKKRLRLHITRT